MKRRLFALATIALLATVSVTPAIAKDAGKSACMKGGWQSIVRQDGTAFIDQGSCVSYVANGGTTKPPGPVSTFQGTCGTLGGGYHTWIFADGVQGEPACTWSSITIDALNAAFDALKGYCPEDTIVHSGTASFGLVGCIPYE
jgi:hypothetical protein